MIHHDATSVTTRADCFFPPSSTVATAMPSLFLWLIHFLAAFMAAQACGVGQHALLMAIFLSNSNRARTHLIILARARTYFPKDINGYDRYMRAGAFSS
jgi:hypothetical protein